MQVRWGCRLIVFLLIMISGRQTGIAQISPGNLSKAHRTLEGATKCTTCHILADGKPRFKCAGCHAEIRVRVEAGRGFHGKAVRLDGGSKQECVRCHTDHYGDHFNMVKWETSREEFDHRKAGYPLEGKHAGLDCARCHQPSLIDKNQLGSIKARDKKRTFLGMSTQCSACHADEHRGQLAGGCARCHTSFSTWKQPSGFQHTAARYVLNGAHAKVACSGCHKPVAAEGKPYARYRDIPFDSCADCHRDPHKGAFPSSCTSCHVETGWKHVRMASSFDHSRTKFPLRGAHDKPGCFQCHKTSNFKEPVAHGLCADCHRKNNPHRAQFATQDCGGCHLETAYKPSTFDEGRHQKLAYKLVGRHAAVECSRCHLPAGKDADYHPAHSACMDCHKDAHGGQFSAVPYRNRCEQCHSEAGFKPSTFTLAKHQTTKFRLTAGHAATACMVCHKVPEGFYPPPPAQFHFSDMRCVACHADPHRNQFEGATKVSCEVCHTIRSWRQTENFDHAATDFPLTGAHRAVGCTECHRPRNLGMTIRQVVFRGAARKCAGCHEDVHAGQFAAKGGDDCASCHNEAAWRPSRFNHETRTRFSLAGAHREVLCRSCHLQHEESGGKTIVMYHRAPSDCGACHRGQ